MYDKAKEYDNVLKAIEKHSIACFQDIELYVAPSKRIMQEWDFHELPTIKDALDKNKVKKKAKMRKKWEESDNPTLQLAAYKLYADDEELAKLNTAKVQTEHSGKIGITKISIIDVDGTEI